MSIAETKQRMRAEAQARRRRAVAETPDAADRIAARVLAAFEAEFGRVPPPVVSGYWAMRDEVDLRPLLKALNARGVTCALPVVEARGRPLLFRVWQPGDALASAAFDLSEPAPDAAEVAPDILLVPLLAFDARGGRLGYGAGYYDVTLAELRRGGRIIAVGIGYDAQEVAETPMTDRDQRLDWVVTERRVIDCAG